MLDAAQASRHDLGGLRLEPALLEALGHVAEVARAEVLLGIVHAADVGGRLLDVLGDAVVLLARQHQGDGRAGREHAAQVLVAALLRDGVVGVQQLAAAERLGDALDDGVVAVAVVDHGVALARVQQPAHVVLRLARHADERVDVALDGQLQRVVAHGRGGAVDDQRDRLRGRRRGLGQVQARVQTDDGG